MSLSPITSYISPSVPASLVKPTAAASFIEDEPSRRPTFTRRPVPSSDWRRFCACAGPCDDQPMTPICRMPSKALVSKGNRWRPPATMVSSRSAILTTRVSNTLEVKLISQILGLSWIVFLQRPVKKGERAELSTRMVAAPCREVSPPEGADRRSGVLPVALGAPSRVLVAIRSAQRRIDERIGDPAGNGLDFPVSSAPDVAQDDIGLDAVDPRQSPYQPVEATLAQPRLERHRCVAEDVDAMAAAIGFLGQPAGAFQRHVRQRDLQGRAQLRLEFHEAREGLAKEFLDALATVGDRRGRLAHRAEAEIDHRRDHLAARREIAVGGGARYACMLGDLGDRGDLALAEKDARMFKQESARPPFRSLPAVRLFHSAALVCELHANEAVGVSAGFSLSRPCKARPVPAWTGPCSAQKIMALWREL